MKKERKIKMILEMREAIYDGMSFQEYFDNSQYKDVAIHNATKAWNRANILCEDWEEWRKFELEYKLIPAFRNFILALNDYFGEGHGIYKLDEALNLSKSTTEELFRLVEG